MFLNIQIFSRYGFLDMWKMLPGIFQYFNVQISNFGNIDISVKTNIRYFGYVSQLPTWVASGLDSITHKSCRIPREFAYGITSVRGDPADRIPREFTPGMHPKHKKWASIKHISDGFQFSNESHDWISWKFGQLDHLWQRWFHWRKVNTLILDSPKGDYTRQNGLV